MSKTKNRIMALFVTSSFPVMLLFQNCGQQGSLQVTGNAVAANASMEAGNDIPKDPVVNDPTNSSGGMVIVPPSNPPVVQPPTSSPVQPPSQPPVVVNPPVAQPPTTSPVADCKGLEIADIRLSISGVGGEEHTCGGRGRYSRSSNSPDFELVDSNASVTLNSQKIRIRALKNIELKQIFIRLSETGNQVLGMNNVAMNLFTPSAQESGLKVKLSRSVKLKKDQIYELHLDFRIEDQIVANANKCIFKPVIKAVKIEMENNSSDRHHDGHRCDRDDRDEDDDHHEDHDDDHNRNDDHDHRQH